MRALCILGSTGSIGTQALDVVRRNTDRFRVLGLGAGANQELLVGQIREFMPPFVAIADGVDVVVVDGPFYEAVERAQLLDGLRTKLDVRYVTLRVTFEEALRRTNADPDPRRDTSRQREWLLKHHLRAESLFPLLIESDLIVETDGVAPAAVADWIVAGLALR